jgi:hypothetical protein
MTKLDPHTWIASLDIGPRTRSVLRNFNYYDHKEDRRQYKSVEKVSDITLYPRSVFVEQQNCGEYVMKQIDSIMDTFGLTYADGKPPVLLTNTATLRDQFAMAALTGLVVANYGRKDVDPLDVASWAYGIADAMMGARR